MLPQFLTSYRQIWQAYKIVAEDENRPGEFWHSAPIIFYDSNSTVLYAANGNFSSNACRKLKTISITNRQDGIRVQMVVKLISKIQMTKIEADSRMDI